MDRTGRIFLRRSIRARFFSACLAASAALLLAFTTRAQLQPTEEVVANLAAGRVVFCVTDDGIVVGGVENSAEPGSHPPLLVPGGDSRFIVLLGAVDWRFPSSGEPSLRLDAELPSALTTATSRPTIGGPPSTGDIGEIERLGVQFLEVLRRATERIHHNLNLAPNEPLVELLLADYAPGYGPEIWSLRYRVRQQSLGNDYWTTRPLRPAYYQLYPPERGDPHTLMEVNYPADSGDISLLERLEGNDPALAPILAASPEIAEAVEKLLAGDSRDASSEPVAQFLHGALPATTGSNIRFFVGRLQEGRGLQWLVAPPEDRGPAAEPQPRDPGAPSLGRD